MFENFIYRKNVISILM